MFVRYLDRTGKMMSYRMHGMTDAHCFPSRTYANACAAQLVRDRYSKRTEVVSYGGQVLDRWCRFGWLLRHTDR